MKKILDKGTEYVQNEYERLGRILGMSGHDHPPPPHTHTHHCQDVCIIGLCLDLIFKNFLFIKLFCNF